MVAYIKQVCTPDDVRSVCEQFDGWEQLSSNLEWEVVGTTKDNFIRFREKATSAAGYERSPQGRRYTNEVCWH